MKYVQIIFSPTGGTQKTAEIITAEWSGNVETLDLTQPGKAFADCHFQADDLVLIALPSYGGRVPALAAERLAQIQGGGAKCVLLCVYGNRAYEDTLVEMADIAKTCGFAVCAGIAAVAEHSIMRQYAAGRPDGQDERNLRDFAQGILKKLQAGEAAEPAIPGNRPYKKAGAAGLTPKATKDCTKCGLCAEKCPAQAISPAHMESADAAKCISCMRCVAICPHAARKANGAVIAVAALAIKKACDQRKECELFI